jgi:hypothetical protein
MMYEVNMKARKRRKAASLPSLMTNLTLASWETMARRTMLIAQNTCSPAEYQRMVSEKAAAAMESGMKLFFSGGLASMTSLMAPWSSRATANVKRLRKSK